DRYSWTRADWATEAGQIRAAEFAHAIGCDHHWLDAAWFVGGFPNGAGNWFHKPAEFPRGLKPVSDACHRLGLKFVLGHGNASSRLRTVPTLLHLYRHPPGGS
ncbi:MAG TPA: alpha-galactosidase, partial [Phycisphaerae bacterium]|nr:alpha-galactosidase [Phycisphaerae bacterium]